MKVMYAQRTAAVNDKCTGPGMEARGGAVHHTYMAKESRHPGHFLREWRKYRGYTLEQVADRVGTTHATLSRIERGKLPYNQALLEILADAYSTDPASLIIRNPSGVAAIWSIWDTLSPPQQTQVVEHAMVIKRTGTQG